MRYNIGAMKKLKIYLDTSVINFALDKRDIEKNKITLQFLEEIKAGKHEVFISDLVIAEINKAPQEIAVRLRDVIKSIELEELNVNEEVESLAEKYIEQNVIPTKYANDAIHIAVASVNGLDVVVSWNFEHMVKHKTRVEVMGINTFIGYKAIDICPPQEVVENV